MTGLLLAFAALPASAQDVVVEGADGNVWNPDELEIEAGTTVTFDMVGGDAGHDVAMDGENLVPFTTIGGSGEYTFDEPGEFVLTCTVHAGMDLALTVTEGDGSGGTDAAAPDDEPADEDPADEPADDEPAEDDAAGDDAAGEDAEVAAGDGEGTDEGGAGQTALLVAIVAAVVLMIASFAVIRRQE